MHFIKATRWATALGALMLAAACGSQSPIQDTIPSAGSDGVSPPAAAATGPITSPTSSAAAPATTAIQEPSEPESTTVRVEAPVVAEVGYAVGDRIPDFTLTLVDGSTFSSEDLISEGRPVFLFFTASW